MGMNFCSGEKGQFSFLNIMRPDLGPDPSNRVATLCMLSDGT
jgi:hypothetical protein